MIYTDITNTTLINAKVQLSKAVRSQPAAWLIFAPPHRRSRKLLGNPSRELLSSMLSPPHLINSTSPPGGQPAPIGCISTHSRNTNVLLSTSLHGRASPSWTALLQLPRKEGSNIPWMQSEPKGQWTLTTVKCVHDRLGSKHRGKSDLKSSGLQPNYCWLSLPHWRQMVHFAFFCKFLC